MIEHPAMMAGCFSLCGRYTSYTSHYNNVQAFAILFAEEMANSSGKGYGFLKRYIGYEKPLTLVGGVI